MAKPKLPLARASPKDEGSQSESPTAVNEQEYATTETVQKSSDAVLFRAVRRSDGHRVLLKVAQDGGAEPLRRLLRERDIGKLLPDDCTILAPVDVATVEGRPALVLVDFPGHPLEEELGRPISVERALLTAARLAGKLGELHARGIVHRDLKPQNVFVEDQSGEVRLTGLGVALSSAGAYRSSSEPGLIEGTFAYMAPEQTGHTASLVDQRADLYSLGVVLYRMLTGKLPLEAGDALGWIHAHVAARPPPLTALVSVPPAVGEIVDKLLAKDPEERYQTASGLVADLEECLVSLRSRGSITPFPLGRRDVPERLQIPQRLHGREAEVRSLTEAFDRVRAERGELVFLTGPPGIGKSSVAKALERHALSCGAIFLEGKHEELRRDVPYFALAQALEQLAHRLLTESEEKLAAWRTHLQDVLGASASLLGTLAPKFGLILEAEDRETPGAGALVDQPAFVDPRASPVAADRFKLFFERFLSAVASFEHPLVFFLDDLQWADPATLDLIEHVLARPTVKHVLTVGTYRDEDRTSPALGAMVARLCAGGLASRRALPALSTSAIAELLTDAFRCSVQEAATLAELLRDRAGGNPLFVTDLLRRLHQEGLIQFERSAARWRWDVERIRRVPLAEGAAELVLAKIEGLAPAVQQALQAGACLGIEFQAADVARALDRSLAEVERDLDEGAADGLLLDSAGAFRFPHDRVREAAYSRLPPPERASLHLRIGRSLLARTNGAAQSTNEFVIADQLNRALSLMTTGDERKRLAVLDLAVGRKAKAASAYASAAHYFASGMAALGESAWT
ncbi:MAG: Signal transduction histidine kinase CheA, partial [Labilithrix sp.]|nr:Signal transduction histidine kinase CheA [Labilithrix sp.]